MLVSISSADTLFLEHHLSYHTWHTQAHSLSLSHLGVLCLFFLMYPSHVCCFVVRNSLGSESPTTVRTLLFLTSMHNTLNFCNSFGGCSKERGNYWLYFLFFSWHFLDTVAIKGDKEVMMLCLYSRRCRGV